MKRILIILTSLFLVGNANADTRILEVIPKKKFNTNPKDRAYLVCIDGYKFIYTYVFVKNPSTTMTQFFEERDGKSLPAKC